MIRGVLALVSVISALAITQVHAQQAPPAAAPARLFGRVVAADTGAPVRSAGIRVVATNPGTGTLVATTDDGGAFDVREVPPGQYLVHVTKPGFVGTRFSLTSGTTDPFGVTAGQQIDMRDLRLPRAGVVSGRVSDGFGDPVADIAVVAWRVEYLLRRAAHRQPGVLSDERPRRVSRAWSRAGQILHLCGPVRGRPEGSADVLSRHAERIRGFFHRSAGGPGGDWHAVSDALVSLRRRLGRCPEFTRRAVSGRCGLAPGGARGRRADEHGAVVRGNRQTGTLPHCERQSR